MEKSKYNLTDYVFVPIDVPKIDFDRTELCAWFDSKKAEVDKERYDFIKPIDFPWNVVQIRPDWLKPKADEIPGSGWEPEFIERFPNFKEVIENLPFDKIIRVYILEQFKEVLPHKDVSKEKDPLLGPSTFRCPIVFDEPGSTFYFIKDSDPAAEIYPSFPDNHPYWFCMNNYTAKHGSHPPSLGKRKLMLCIWGEVNVTKFVNFISDNISKYSEYCIKV